jgi:hypothetical protein
MLSLKVFIGEPETRAWVNSAVAASIPATVLVKRDCLFD